MAKHPPASSSRDEMAKSPPASSFKSVKVEPPPEASSMHAMSMPPPAAAAAASKDAASMPRRSKDAVSMPPPACAARPKDAMAMPPPAARFKAAMPMPMPPPATSSKRAVPMPAPAACCNRPMSMPPPTGSASTSNGRKRTYDVLSDTLECPICLQPFSLPVFQCRNGHSACMTCCKKLAEGCPSCSQPVGEIRNVAIEKIIRSLLVDCQRSPQGCTAKLMYCDTKEIEEHENKRCEYRPMLCPMQMPRQCLYIGPGVTICEHLEKEHGIRTLECRGPRGSQTFTMKSTCPMVMLKTDEALLIVNCWRGSHNFGSYVFCSVFGNSKLKVLHKLSLEHVRHKKVEKVYFTFTCLQAIAMDHSLLDLERITMDDVFFGPYLNIPHDDHERVDMEFDVKVTLIPNAETR